MTELPVTSYGRKVIGEKSRLVSLILNFMYAGLGIIYAGNLRKGLIFFISDLVMLALIIVSYIWMGISTISLTTTESTLDATSIANMMEDVSGIIVPSIIITIGCLVMLVLVILSMVFGYQMCKENNKLWVDYLEKN